LTAQVYASPAELTFSRRELFIWFAAILFATKLFQSVAQVSGLSFRDTQMIQAAGLGAFQLVAWFAVFRLFLSESPQNPATGRDFAVIGVLGIVNIALGMTNVMPAQRAVWIVATIAAIYIYFSSAKASYARAAATVLLALAVQALWGPVFFSLFDYDLLRGDAALVGTLLDATQSGYAWHDNVVGTDVHSIAIYSGCSSFHNVSLAMLCWVALTKLSRPSFIATDFIFGAAVCLVMIAVNIARLYVAALSFDAYQYWHNGNGAHIFQVGVSVLILVISLWGSSLRDPRHA